MSLRHPKQRPPGEDRCSDTAIVVVLTSEAGEMEAKALALQLLERRLVACVSLLPVRSLYHWQGRLEEAEEVKLLLKTAPALLAALHAALLELHSYETPEWIVLEGSSRGGYGEWLGEQLRRDGPQQRPEAPRGA